MSFIKLLLWIVCALWSAYMSDTTLRYHGNEVNTHKRYTWACSFWLWVVVLAKSVINIFNILRSI